MEQMMGVEEPLSEELVEQAARSAMGGRLVDIIRLTSTFAGLLASHITLERRIAAFYRRLDGALAPPCPALEDRRPDELAAHYRELRGRLLRNWDAPLVNDFFAMVFYGVLRRMVTRWCGDPGGTLQNDLIGGSGGMLSAEPAVLLRRLAELAAEHAKLLERLGTGTSDDILSDLQQYPELLRVCQTYLAKFGDRTFGELKLESAPLQDDPLPLFRAIGTLGRQIAAARASTDASAPNTADRVRAESRLRVSRALAGHPVRRLTFSWVLRHARRRIRDRENLRLERTRLFARIRQIFLELGRCLHAVDLLDDARDVMYLEVEEVLAFVDGRSTCTNLRALAALRRQEFRDFENTPAPASRFETRGPVYYGHDCQRVRPRAVETGEERRGLGCSAGLVRGPVRIVSDPRTVDLGGRWILVTAYTDPGWIMVFPAALGVLVERGSPLSHAAIVARELGIPAVVSVPGITAWVRDGDWIEMDGGTGVVRRITTPTEQNRLTGAAAPTVVAGRASVEGAVAHA
jgi:pyruvate,water dikinase